MNDIIISRTQQKRELKVLLLCFAIAFILNIIAIIIYKTSWSELLTSIDYVCIVALFLYVISGFIRFLIFLFKKVIGRRRK